jgi:hypothetical protein
MQKCKDFAIVAQQFDGVALDSSLRKRTCAGGHFVSPLLESFVGVLL